MASKQETDLTGSASNNKNRRAFCGPYALSYRKGWENARGCRIEHEAAKAYGLEIMYEE